MAWLRQFGQLLPGWLNTTDTRQVIVTGYLGYAATAEIKIGLGVVRTGKVGDADLVVLPQNSSQKFWGIILKDEAAYRAVGQTPNTRKGQDLVPIIREAMGIKVHAAVAVAVNDPVYCIYAAGADQGKFTNVATNAIAVNGIWRETTTAPGTAELEFYL